MNVNIIKLLCVIPISIFFTNVCADEIELRCKGRKMSKLNGELGSGFSYVFLITKEGDKVKKVVRHSTNSPDLEPDETYTLEKVQVAKTKEGSVWMWARQLVIDDRGITLRNAPAKEEVGMAYYQHTIANTGEYRFDSVYVTASTKCVAQHKVF